MNERRVPMKWLTMVVASLVLFITASAVTAQEWLLEKSPKKIYTLLDGWGDELSISPIAVSRFELGLKQRAEKQQQRYLLSQKPPQSLIKPFRRLADTAALDAARELAPTMIEKVKRTKLWLDKKTSFTIGMNFDQPDDLSAQLYNANEEALEELELSFNANEYQPRLSLGREDLDFFLVFSPLKQKITLTKEFDGRVIRQMQAQYKDGAWQLGVTAGEHWWFILEGGQTTAGVVYFYFKF